MPGRPKKKRQKSAHESPSRPNRVTRDDRRMTCSKCKKEGHNKATFSSETVLLQGPPKKRGRPPKIIDPAFPLPHKRRKTPTRRHNQPQPSSSAHQQSLGQETLSQASSAPPSTQPSASTVPPSAPKSGRPPGRGDRKETVPIGHGVFMSPYTNRVFECFGSVTREVGGGSHRGGGRGWGVRGRGQGVRGRGQGGIADGGLRMR